jgi:hypothetical protein
MKSFKHDSGNAFFLLILAALVFMLLSRVPFGNLIQWPFLIITTFIHEMGHGLAALAVGSDLIKIEINYDGSGTAFTRTIAGSDWRRASIAAGGLLAPSVTGALFIRAGLKPRSSAITFLCLSLFILVCCALWVRTTFGLMLLIPVGIIFLMLSRKTSQGFQQFLIQFIGVHMLVDTFTGTLSYIFTKTITRDGGIKHSDTSTIAEHLVGGHLLWAIIIATLSFSIVFITLRKSYFK